MTTPATSATRGSGPSLMKLVQHIPEARRWRRQADALIVIGRQFELMAQERGVEAHVALGTLRFSLFHLHQGRIAQLAPLCRSVTVYGEADVAPPTIPHVTFVPTPAGSPLSQEWFLVVDSPVFWGSMISRASMDRANSAARRYQFEGVLTAEERVVSRASLLLSLARGQAPPEAPQRDPVANAARWARIAYALASHSEAQRLKLIDCLGELPELQSLLAEAALEYDQMVPLAMDALRRFCGTVGELLYRYTDGALTPVAWSAASPPPPHSLAEGLVGQAFQQGRLTMQPLVPTDPEYALLGGAASAMAIPISVRGQAWGVLLIGQAEPDPHEAEGLARAVGLATLLEQLIETRGGAADQSGLRPPIPATLTGTSPAPGPGRQPSAPVAAPGAMGPGTAAPFGAGGAPTPAASPFGAGGAPTPAASPFSPADGASARAASPFGADGASARAASPFGAGGAPAPAASPFGAGGAPTPAASPFGPGGGAPAASPFGPGNAPTPAAAPFGPGGGAPAASPFGASTAPAAAPFGPGGGAPAPAASPFGPGGASAPAAAPFGPGGGAPAASPFGAGGAPAPAAAPFGPGASTAPGTDVFGPSATGAAVAGPDPRSVATPSPAAFRAGTAGGPVLPAPPAPQFGLPPWLRSSAAEAPAGGPGAPAQNGMPGPQPGPLPPSQGFPIFQRRLMGALVAFDQNAAEEVWREAGALYPAEALCTELLMPVQVAIGEGWHRGEISVATEHFATRFAESKLHNLFTAHRDNPHGPLAVIGCAQGELHELGALTIALFLKWAGFRVNYLGQTVPNSTLETLVRTLRPQILGLSATTVEAAHNLTETGQILSRIEPPRPLFIFGGMAFYERPDLRARVQGGQFLDGDPRAIARRLAAQFMKE